MVSWWRRFAAATACTSLAFVLGCPQQQSAAPSATSPKVTAPATQTSSQAPSRGTTTAPEISASPAPTPAETRKLQQIVDRAEATYASGVNDYRAGKLESARANFDAAVDLLLTSGMDVKANPQLADELDRLLNQINSLEMSAMKQGNGFSAPIEEAPLSAADEVTFPSNPTLTAKVQNELKTTQSDFPLVVNDYVAGFISYFSNSPSGHAHLLRSLERAGKYKDMISRILREEGVPQDLIYLAVAESGFQPQALNGRSGAGGMWQFMPTGAYGLARTGWVDERFDPEKSSRAYARYIKSLYQQFGDWYLAMAAYDWGPGYVQRSVMRTGYADYWELYRRNVLPQETKNYVPGIIAAIIMAKNPKQYGLDTLVPEPAVISDTVSVDYPIDLRLVADLTNASVPEIVGLNPSLLRMTTPRDTAFDLHLPPGTRDLYTRRIADIPTDKRTSWRYHVVRAGESLENIAGTFHAHPADIESANHLSSSDSIETGDELIIPAASPTATLHTAAYVSRAGDTLVKIADRFNVTVEELRRWNHLSSNQIPPHKTLAVAEPIHLAHEAHVRARTAKGSAAHGSHADALHAKTSSTSTHKSSRKVAPSVAKKSAANAKHSKR